MYIGDCTRVCINVCGCVCASVQQLEDSLQKLVPTLFVCFFKICLFILCEESVNVFRHTRKGHQIPLQMAVSHHVVAGN